MVQVLRGSCHSTQGNGTSLMSPRPGANGEVGCEPPRPSPRPERTGKPPAMTWCSGICGQGNWRCVNISEKGGAVPGIASAQLS